MPAGTVRIGVHRGTTRDIGQRLLVGAANDRLRLFKRERIGFLGNDGYKCERADIAAELARLLDDRLRDPAQLFAAAEDEIKFGVPGSEDLSARRLPGADDGDFPVRRRITRAVRELEELPVEGHAAFAPQGPHYLDIFLGVFVAPVVIIIAGPQAHLLIFRPVPT